MLIRNNLFDFKMGESFRYSPKMEWNICFIIFPMHLNSIPILLLWYWQGVATKSEINGNLKKSHEIIACLFNNFHCFHLTTITIILSLWHNFLRYQNLLNWSCIRKVYGTKKMMDLTTDFIEVCNDLLQKCSNLTEVR